MFWFFAGLLLMPFLEVYMFLEVGRRIGAWDTFLLVLMSGLIGLLVIRHRGLVLLRTAQARLSQGQWPDDTLWLGVLSTLGGILLILPGFISDAVGLLMILPGTRALALRLLRGVLRSKIRKGAMQFEFGGMSSDGRTWSTHSSDLARDVTPPTRTEIGPSASVIDLDEARRHREQ